MRTQVPERHRNFVLITLDSCRYDAFSAAHTPNLHNLGALQRRWSYATWTAPSHYNLLLGLLPHENPRHTHAGAYYLQEFLGHEERLGVSFTSGESLVYLPSFLRRLGYTTRALVSMPALDPRSPINRDFDEFTLMPRVDAFAEIIDAVSFTDDRPAFWLLNAGETHYPYFTGDDSAKEWPSLHGRHGILRELRDGAEHSSPPLFSDSQLRELRARQVLALEHADRLLGTLFNRLPPGTAIVVTSDHGELFGEEGLFGHGPVQHEKVLEVPLFEAVI